MNQLARINHLDLDDTRFAAAQTLDGVYAEPSIAGELRVYDLRQLFPLLAFRREYRTQPQLDCDFPVTGDEQRGYLSWMVRCLGSAQLDR